MASHDDLRYTLNLARACVHKGEALQALGHLKSIQFGIDGLVESSFWAEYQIIYAGTLAGMNDSGAEVAYEEALRCCAQLSVPNPSLAMTAHGDYASYLAGRRAPNRARAHYRQAEKLAETLDREECVAHFQMCVIRLDLEEAHSPHLTAFQRLQEAAKDGYTEVQQREAWIQYMEQFQSLASQVVATRHGGQASTDYFRGLLSAIRRSQK